MSFSSPSARHLNAVLPAGERRRILARADQEHVVAPRTLTRDGENRRAALPILDFAVALRKHVDRVDEDRRVGVEVRPVIRERHPDDSSRRRRRARARIPYRRRRRGAARRPPRLPSPAPGREAPRSSRTKSTSRNLSNIKLGYEDNPKRARTPTDRGCAIEARICCRSPRRRRKRWSFAKPSG